MCPLHKATVGLVWVGALNWGLIGVFNFNLVNALFGSMPTFERVVYILVGVSALALCCACKCKQCGGSESCCEAPKKV